MGKFLTLGPEGPAIPAGPLSPEGPCKTVTFVLVLESFMLINNH